MADVVRDADGEIERVIYRDVADYTIEVSPPSSTGRVRITTKDKAGGGYPVDLDVPEARRLAHDIADLCGPGD